MASTFKTFLGDDIANTRTLLHESIPLTGSIVSGESYTSNNVETNIKTYTHGMFQSVYDYPYESSSANHIFDITFGHHSDIITQGTYDDNADVTVLDAGDISGLDSNASYNKRKNIYNQMAQVLVGHKIDGEIKKFDTDGRLDQGDKYNSLIFINFARLLQKDEIKKGTFEISFATKAAHDDPSTTPYAAADGSITVSDTGAATDYHINSPAGEYGILKLSATTNAAAANGADAARIDKACGLIYYQAGIVALTPELFNEYHNADHPVGFLEATAIMNGAGANVYTLKTGTQDEVCKGVRERILNISFSNTTELNSTIYFCRVGHNDFNYSTNPTYLKESKILVKETTNDSPVSYITTVGLYSSDNELLAVAKLSEPLRKDPTNDITLRVRLDY